MADVRWLQDYIRAREEARGHAMPCDLRQYSAAIGVLNAVLGKQWIDAHFPTGHDGSFLKPVPRQPLDEYKHQERVVALGEMLFNLWKVEGFDERVRDLHTVDIEAAVGELRGAQLLYSSGIRFRFRRRSGTKGEDFDVEAVIDHGTVPCEMKAKIASTRISDRTIEDTLATANAQLPDRQPGAVFLRVPQGWMESGAESRQVARAIRRILPHFANIAMVVVHSERWGEVTVPGVGGKVVSATVFAHFENQTVRVPAGLRAAIEAWRPGRPSQWIDFGKVLCGDAQPDVFGTPANAPLISVAMRVPSVHVSQTFGLGWNGSVKAVRSREPAKVRTILNFTCTNLDFAHQWPEDKVLIVSVDSEPKYEVTFFRGPTPDSFQLQIPFCVLDSAFRESDGAIVPELGRQWDLARSGEFVVFLEALFAAMRRQGDLAATRCVMSNPVLAYLDADTGAELLVLEYLESVFAV